MRRKFYKEESWRAVKGFEGFYEVSDFGNVRSVSRVIERKHLPPLNINGKLIKPALSNYYKVTLCKNGNYSTLYVHRLVADAFIGDVKGKVVNHIDLNKKNNQASNLEVVSQKQNCLHYHQSVVTNKSKGSSHGRSRLNIDQVLAILTLPFEQHEYAARVYGVSKETVRSVQRRLHWSDATIEQELWSDYTRRRVCEKRNQIVAGLGSE